MEIDTTTPPPNFVMMNKVYDFKLNIPTFGDLTKNQIIELFRDGRHISPFLERQLCYWFPEIHHITGNKDHDHEDEFGNQYDLKNFTKNGLKFCPSNQIGAGRYIDKEKASVSANKLIYILADIIEYPKIRIRFVKGNLLMSAYPKFTIPLKDREKIFGKDFITF